jgi:hypothetical protein
MGFETPEPVIYPPLPSLVVEDPWALYYNAGGEDDNEDDEIEEESERRR